MHIITSVLRAVGVERFAFMRSEQIKKRQKKLPPTGFEPRTSSTSACEPLPSELWEVARATHACKT